MTDKMRQEFEVWFWNEFHSGSNAALNWCSVFSIGSDGKYNGIGCHAAWLAWKASRATLCVELPSRISDDSDKWSVGYDFGVDMAADALDSAGVRYKWQA